MASPAKKASVTDRPIGNTETVQSGSRVLDLAEACEFLGVAKVTMYGYIKRGLIPAFKYPGSRVWKFDRADLESWLEAQKRGGGR